MILYSIIFDNIENIAIETLANYSNHTATVELTDSNFKDLSGVVTWLVPVSAVASAEGAYPVAGVASKYATPLADLNVKITLDDDSSDTKPDQYGG